MIVKNKIILASASSIRKKMLEVIGLNFITVDSKLNENKLKAQLINLEFTKQAEELALQKALLVSKQYPQHLIIGADQICALDSENIIFNKPDNYQQAKQQLIKMQGKEHSQNTAFCLCLNTKVIFKYSEKTIIHMKNLSEKQIDAYLKLDKPLNCAGSYRLEANANTLFKKIIGDEDSVKGMPLKPLIKKLQELKVI